jgi:hypothetical protein
MSVWKKIARFAWIGEHCMHVPVIQLGTGFSNFIKISLLIKANVLKKF